MDFYIYIFVYIITVIVLICHLLKKMDESREAAVSTVVKLTNADVLDFVLWPRPSDNYYEDSFLFKAKCLSFFK